MTKYFDSIGEDINNYMVQNKQPEYYNINYNNKYERAKMMKHYMYKL